MKANPFTLLVRTVFAGLTLLAALSVQLFAQTNYASWNFETNTPADVTNAAASPFVNAEIGTGIASGLHVTAATDWSTPTGNFSSNAFSSNEWLIGDYYQFQVTVPGMSPTFISWDQTRSSTGPSDFKLAWSFNGTTFNDYYSYTVVASTGTNIVYSDLTTGGGWLTSKLATNTSYLVDLTSITSEFSSTTLYVRLIAATGSTNTTGTSRIDNVSFTSAAPAAIPEPSTYAAIAGGLIFAAAIYRRQKRG